MKARLLPILCAGLAFAAAARAQESTSPESSAAPAPALPTRPASNDEAASAPGPGPSRLDPSLDLMPAQPGQLIPPPAQPEPSLIPEPPASTEKRDDRKLGKSKTEIVEEEMALRIHFRQAETKALQDPTFQTELATANASHTDYEKREALKKYYKRLYTRIRQIDPSVKQLANEREAFSTRRLTQVRIAPTEPLDAADRSTSPVLSTTFTTDDL